MHYNKFGFSCKLRLPFVKLCTFKVHDSKMSSNRLCRGDDDGGEEEEQELEGQEHEEQADDEDSDDDDNDDDDDYDDMMSMISSCLGS